MSSSQPINRWLVLLAVILAFLPIVVDFTILHIAVPSLTLALHATGTEVLWIIDIYPLVMASLMIPLGTLADRIGHRRLLLTGLSIFLLASVAAAYSPTSTALIAARAAMACGSAMVIPCVLAIIRQTFTDEGERAFALGVWGSVASAGAAVGPLIGGVLLEHFWWGSVFLVNVPIMLLIGPLVLAYTPRHAITGTGNWTIGQAVVLMVGLITTIYAIKSGFKPDSSLVVTAAMLAFGLAMLTWFVQQQRRSPRPMLDISLFAKPAITTGVIMALVVMGALAGVELTLAQELQFVIGHTPLEAGLFMLPLMIGSAVGGPVTGALMGAVGLRLVASASLLISAACLAGLGLSDFHHPGISVTAMLGLLGLALSIGMTSSSVAIMSSSPPEKAGSAGALEASSYDLGNGLGITGFGLVLTATYTRAIDLPAEVPADLAANAAHSIGETMTAAAAVGGPLGDAMIDAGRLAFSHSHNIVLLTSALLIAVLGGVVAVILRNYRPVGEGDSQVSESAAGRG